MAVLREPGHVYELANAAYRQLVGDREIIGKPIREALPELEAQGFIDLLDRVFTTGEPFIGRAVRVMLRRGPDAAEEERFVDFVFQPIRDPDGRTDGIFIDGSDVTDLVRARERSACLVELGDRLRDLNDTGEIAQTAAELLGRTLGISRAGYGRVDPSGQYVTIERDWTNGKVRASPASTGSAITAPSPKPSIVARSLSFRTSPPTPVPPTASKRCPGVGVAALINVPVIEDGRFSSVLYIHNEKPRAWSPQEVDLIRDVADRTWAAAERARSEILAAPPEPDAGRAGHRAHARPRPHVAAVHRHHAGRPLRRHDRRGQPRLGNAARLGRGRADRRQLHGPRPRGGRGPDPERDRTPEQGTGHPAVREPLPPQGRLLPLDFLGRRPRRELHPRGRPRHHRRTRSAGRSPRRRGCPSPRPEDGSRRPAYRRRRP